MGELEAFLEAIGWKQVIMLARNELPQVLHRDLWEYLGLFRSEKRSLTSKRTLTILSSLRDLVAPGRVRWEKSEERPCPPEIWAEAMRAAIEREPRLEHLKDHNYIRHTAWSKARPLAAQAERTDESRKQREGRSFVFGALEAASAPEETGEARATKGDIRALAEALGKAFDADKKLNCHTCKHFEVPRWCRLDPKAVRSVDPAKACGKHTKR